MNVSDRVIELYDLETRGKAQVLADKMGISLQAVHKYKFADTPPQKLLQQIAIDFDGKEGRPLINWNWLFTGIEPKFKNSEELPPEPTKSNLEDSLTLESLKEIFLDKFSKMELELRELKSNQFKSDLTIKGIGVEMQGMKEIINLGKLNTNSKNKILKPKFITYYPMVNKLSKLG